MKSIHSIFIILSISFLFILSGCNKESIMQSADTGGKGGSTARFTTIGNYLYIVDNTSLLIYNISNPLEMKEEGKVDIGFGIETIFPFQNNLFIGSVDAMYIFGVDNPRSPNYIGMATHVRSCDPVVANDSIAYVTLRSSSGCGGVANVLNIYDITNQEFPRLLSDFQLEEPYGLGLLGDYLYVCDGKMGLVILNVQNPNEPKIVYKIEGYSFRDLIPYDNKLFVSALEGMIIYDVSNPLNPILLQVLK